MMTIPDASVCQVPVDRLAIDPGWAKEWCMLRPGASRDFSGRDPGQGRPAHEASHTMSNTASLQPQHHEGFRTTN
jgi:hypothetical protein